MKVLFIVNIIFSICSLIGLIVWTIQDDIYTLTSIYGFYWFVSVLSLISSLLGYLFHTTSFINEKFKRTEYGIYVMFFYSFIMTLFWLCASASVARVTRDCLYIKKKYSSIVDYYYSNSEFTCNGEIVTMTFGFVLFIIWSFVLLFVSKKLYLRIMNTVSQDVAIEMSIKQRLEEAEIKQRLEEAEIKQ